MRHVAKEQTEMQPKALPKTVIYAALGADLAIACIKFTASVLTGSSAMLSEGVHSLVDSVNELLLLYGSRRAAKPADASHPFGYGRELYFWSFIVALLVLGLGAGVSLYEGITHLLNPAPMKRVLMNYLVLAASFGCEAASWWVAFKAFREAKGDQGYVSAFLASKDPSTFIVLLEDSVAMLGLLLAGAGIALAQAFHAPLCDGLASVAIGLLLAVSSVLLARETKGLLIGEAAHPRVHDSILGIAGADPDVCGVNGVLTVQMGPGQVVAALSAEFQDGLNTSQIEHCVTRIEAAIKRAHPDVRALFVKPQTEETWRRQIEGAAPRETISQGGGPSGGVASGSGR
jgi:cation diffusion facilitator family transporter